MDYFFGSFSTIIVIYFVLKYFNNLYSVVTKQQQYSFSQSSVHEIIKPLLPNEVFLPKKKRTQSYNYEEKTNVRVIILDGKAYWIRDNKFYEADLGHHGIDKETTRIVDIMSLNKVQLDKMLFVMDKLREGLENDTGNTGNN